MKKSATSNCTVLVMQVARCGVFPAVYAVVSQPSGNGVGLAAAKATLAKQGLTIPRLDLVSGHMAMNIILNVP